MVQKKWWTTKQSLSNRQRKKRQSKSLLLVCLSKEKIRRNGIKQNGIRRYEIRRNENRQNEIKRNATQPKNLTCVLFIKNTCNILCRNRMKTHSMHKMQWQANTNNFPSIAYHIYDPVVHTDMLDELEDHLLRSLTTHQLASLVNTWQQTLEMLSKQNNSCTNLLVFHDILSHMH